MILQRYLTRQVLASTLAISCLLLLIFLSGRFVKYLAEAAAGQIDPAYLFLLIWYRIPSFVELILPLGLFLSLMMVFGRLYLDNEISVMLSAGMSRVQIAQKAVLVVLIVAVIVALNCLYITPKSLERFEQTWKQQKQRSEVDVVKAGAFQSVRGGNGMVYVESTDKKTGEMQQVFLFQQLQQRDGKLDAVIVADTARVERLESHKYLVLENGYRFTKDRADDSYQKLYFSAYGQHLTEPESVEKIKQLKIDAMPSQKLWRTDNREHQSVLHWRLSLILLVPITSIIAIALSKANPRQGRYSKIFPGIALYLLYLVALNMLKSAMMKGSVPVFFAMWWVHLLFLLLGLLLFNWDKVQQLFVVSRSVKTVQGAAA